MAFEPVVLFAGLLLSVSVLVTLSGYNCLRSSRAAVSVISGGVTAPQHSSLGLDDCVRHMTNKQTNKTSWAGGNIIAPLRGEDFR